MQIMKHKPGCGTLREVFSLRETNAMRGLWCLIVVLVHIPAAYQNRIQDMIGSFAYIGVSFFFMTSGFGLMIGIEKNGFGKLAGFWKRRLPKLLIPMVITNMLTMILAFVESGKADWLQLIGITGFVRQLLVFYLVFWAACWFAYAWIPSPYRKRFLYGCVAALVLAVYGVNLIWGGFWPVEAVGFLLGMLLAQHKNKVSAYFAEKWLVKCILACVYSAIFGVMYIKMKHIVFLGDYVIRILLSICIHSFILLVNCRVSVANVLTEFLGKISYEVYLLHGAVFSFLSLLPVTFGSWPFILGSLILTVLLSVVVERISKWVNGRFFGK